MRTQNKIEAVILSGKVVQVKQGMQSSHGEVVAVTVVGRRTQMLTILTALYSSARPVGSRTVHKLISHTVHSSAQGSGDPGWRLPPPPGADAEVFAQREHLSLS